MGNQSQIAGIGMFNTALGGVEGAIGSYMQGQDQRAMYNYQAGVARTNSIIAAQNATYATQVGEQEALQTGMAGAQRMGLIRAAQGSHGLDVNSGSNKDVQSSQAFLNRFSQTNIRASAAKTAYNYQVQGTQFQAQAGLDTLAGQNAATAGLVGASSSILGASSAVSSEWLRGAQLGLWGGTTQSSNYGA
jgi:hypothetical protein